MIRRPSSADNVRRAARLLPELVRALRGAQLALNVIPRTKLPGEHRDSYEVAALVDAALASVAREGWRS